ncbi:MAG: aminoacyl-tRNA hydrolase [Candidatus Buchananbacteria bacterium RBG_13_36_9]|uniref:Peptidyl-tRNA hydrolase n=1 Tax=Candidatus Buchananbacteria bacterium RBG_13_36_9 TaxID=1797530 RepID=A0A1G1XNZ6_9BACT|nr:MAG: aminoacyl-tRNA hydrolase [Candidatus Buchananbacteria bacterium RBG_13_36_9]
MKFIIGLGNPGPEYQNNRHNIGFQTLDQLSANFKLEKKFKAEISKGDNFILAKPQTFMNNSGQAVKALKTFYKIKPENIIIIHDDIDLPIGKIRISQGSSSGGNKGVDSIIKEIGSKNFIRIRVGIANSQRVKIPADKFVLQNFNPSDKKILKYLMPQILEALNMLIADESITKVQNKFN